MNTCQSIDHIVELAEAEGNTICSISKSELMEKVIWMNNALPTTLRNKIQMEITGVEYKKTKDMPHESGTEYFVCHECKELVVFPLRTAR